MKVTFWLFFLPLLLIAAAFVVDSNPHPRGPTGVYGAVLFFWILGGAPATVIYWITRLVRRSWRDGSASSPARPAGWIYPNER